MSNLKKVCVFGGFTPGYPRHEVICKGLNKCGVATVECRTNVQKKWPGRYARLAMKYSRMARDFDLILVPEFCHKDVPLAHFLGRMSGKPVVFDPLVSRYDTKVLDRGDAKAGSYQAWHNRNIDRISMSLPDLVLADTQAHATYYAREFGVPPERLRVVPVGADEDVFNTNGQQGTTPSAPFVVLFFGNYLPLHGVDVIAEAAALLRGEEGIRFVLIGGGQTYEAVRSYVERERLDNVELRERVPLESLSGLLAGAHVSLGIFGSSEKTLRVVPNKIYQAMAAGRPVVTADSPAVREFFTDSENIFLVPPGDPRALADRIRALRDHPRTLAAVGEAGTVLVRKRFSSKDIGELFIASCEVLLDP